MSEKQRILEMNSGASSGATGGLISANASGEVFEKTTALVEPPGIIFLTTMLEAALIAGAKMVLPGSVTRAKSSVSHWPFGMGRILS